MELLLVRHAHCASCGPLLAGRDTSIQLDQLGLTQAHALGEWLAAESLDAVYTSPLPRAHQTAREIARRHGLEPVPCSAFLEVDYGEWTGRTLSDLARHDPERWRAYNERRSTARVPGGESIAEVQARAVQQIVWLQEHHRDGSIAIVTHAEVIRAVLTHCLRMSLDDCLRLDVAPASVSRVAWHGGRPVVRLLNATIG